MEQYSIISQNPLPDTSDPEQSVRQTREAQSGAPSSGTAMRFPGEDGGRSLAAMAQRDLDAALHLLAERAQYVTGASGAAIALRRRQHNDLICRASAGPNVPELGTLFSAESGLSGESVRTRAPLRCDDTERDPRVNRDGCRELGIASVVVMPIVGDDDVLGVFELFSGNVCAFGEPELSALQRLCEMVETAVTLAETAQRLSSEGAVENPAVDKDSTIGKDEAKLAVAESVISVDVPVDLAKPEAVPGAPQETKPPADAPKNAQTRKPLLWSAAFQSSPESQTPQLTDQSNVPPVLRNLRKCWACGFPVSEGRKLCVECEEKQWRGQLRTPLSSTPAKEKPVLGLEMQRAVTAQATAALQGGSSESEPVFSGGLAPAESWFSANKYIIGAFLVIVGVIVAIVLLR